VKATCTVQLHDDIIYRPLSQLSKFFSFCTYTKPRSIYLPDFGYFYVGVLLKEVLMCKGHYIC
jgi:hypothetical protein